MQRDIVPIADAAMRDRKREAWGRMKKKRLLAKLYERNMRLLRVARLALFLIALPVYAGDFEEGMKFILDKDYTKAAEAFRRAADQGNVDAQFNLAVMYSKGRGVPQNNQEAAHWYRMAADQGDVPSQSKIG